MTESYQNTIFKNVTIYAIMSFIFSTFTISNKRMQYKKYDYDRKI